MKQQATFFVGCRALCMAGILLAATATPAALLVYESFDRGVTA